MVESIRSRTGYGGPAFVHKSKLAWGSAVREVGARPDVRLVRLLDIFGNGKTGYTIAGPESIRQSLVDGSKEIVGWENTDGSDVKWVDRITDGSVKHMTPEERSGLTLGGQFRAIWERLEPGPQDLDLVPTGKIIAFIPLDIDISKEHLKIWAKD